MISPVRLGVLISGGGSNLQAIMDACASGILRGHAEVAVVIANRPDAFGLERARRADIPALVVAPGAYPSREEHACALGDILRRYAVTVICLAGYLSKIEPVLIRQYEGRMLNIHPALLPKFGGKGMYGHHVHEAVIAAGEKESGATVHLVDGEYDHGQVVLQGRVPVLDGDTAGTLAQRVLELEHDLYPRAILNIVQGGTQ